MSSTIVVAEIANKWSSPEEKTKKPDHWGDSKPSGFINPWPSFRKHSFKDMFSLVSHSLEFPSVKSEESARLFAIRKPTWGEDERDKASGKKDKIISTWLGHACFLVEMPSRSNSVGRGARILFDPVFSDRCSPSQYIGPKRYTPPPCKIEEIPEVDAIVISHNHYDHLDVHTINILSKRTRIPHFFAPLGNKAFFQSFGIPESHIHIMDWWDSKRVEITSSSASTTTTTTAATAAAAVNHPDSNNKDETQASTHDIDGNNNHKIIVDITCTPAQHFTGRSLFDRFKTLWSSWVVEEVRSPPPSHHDSSNPNPVSSPTNPPVAGGLNGVKVFFGGDTGYRAVMDGQDENEVPACPAFKEIGVRFGGFEFAMIPIGAYMPRQFMSPIHCAPQDSVQLFKDIRAKKALGMHWGTWVLTSEDVAEPPKRLAKECESAGIEDGAFGVCEIGETMFF